MRRPLDRKRCEKHEWPRGEAAVPRGKARAPRPRPPRSPRLIFHLCHHQPLIEELRWPHGGHDDRASTRAGSGVRRWARGRPGRASAARFAASQRQQRAGKATDKAGPLVDPFRPPGRLAHQDKEGVLSPPPYIPIESRARARARFSSEAFLTVF